MTEYSVSAISRWATAAFIILIFVIAWIAVEIYRREFEAKRQKIAAQCDRACNSWSRLLDERNVIINEQEKTIRQLNAEIAELNEKLERKNEILRSVHMDDLIEKGENQ